MASDKRDERNVNTDSWLTANQVADVCNISLVTVANYKRSNPPRLRPRRAMRLLRNGSMKEVEVFDPQEIANLPRRPGTSLQSPGELAARAFEMFDEGLALKDVVVELKAEPNQVSVLFEQWSELGGSEFVIGKAAREELGRLVGPFEGVADLVKRIADRIGGARSVAASAEAS